MTPVLIPALPVVCEGVEQGLRFLQVRGLPALGEPGVEVG